MDFNNDILQTHIVELSRSCLEEAFRSDETKNENEDGDIVTMPIPTVISSVFLEKEVSGLPSFARHCKFEWKDLNVFVGDKQILYNFNGSIESGELLAVMGGSGAGKSTLLNVLSGRINLNSQKITGYLAINNKKLLCSDQSSIKSICTYIPQSDILCPTQTVEEALLFYGKLKLSHLNISDIKKRVSYLIHVLHLDKCRKNIIGSESKRGISGGEKRRVCIAAEILNDADIIFLDEPTSGLDAYTAARTIKTLKQFCSVSNKIIIATIHQPSMEVFYLFDKLVLISNGKCCFNSNINDIDKYYKNILRPKTNPADIIVFEVQRNPNKYVSEWNESKLNIFRDDNKLRNKKWNEYKEFDLDDIVTNADIKTNGKMASIKIQKLLLLKRELKGLIRDKRVSLIRLIQVIFFSVICGFIYFKVSQSFNQRSKCFFFINNNINFIWYGIIIDSISCTKIIIST